jgi:two-component system, sporulation sensor kinase E
MKRFVLRALDKLDKMDIDSIRNLVHDISVENELLEMVLNSTTDGVVVTDRENNILLVNKAASRLIPFEKGDISDRCLCEVINDKDIASFINETLEAQERVFDREFVLDDGTGRIISCSIMPLVRNRTIHGNLMHIEDVTEKRAKETRLRRAESLASLTTLTAGVAHEIKNPLASIGIHIQLMQKLVKNRDTLPSSDIQKYLDIVNEEVDRLNMIVVDFLFAVRPMNLKLIKVDIIDFFQYELEEYHIKIQQKLEDVPKIPLDQKYIKQALLNLIKNAQEAMPEGGSLSITTKSTYNNVIIEISDTGTGIPDTIKEKVFEPYFTTKDFSSGLGLTLVFKIVKEHRGEIGMKSKEGSGTTFTISLPIPPDEKRLLDYEGVKDEI